MTIDWNKELSDQMHEHWSASLRPRLDGMTDDEYLWEPVAGCWTVRRGDDGRYMPDWASPAPDPPPVTTIAWRLCHIIGPVLDLRVSNHFAQPGSTKRASDLRSEYSGDGGWDPFTADWPGTADAALAQLDDAYAAWQAGVRSLGAEGLAKAVGPAEGPYADRSYAALILHINREVIHHGAEIALLRDLYRART